VDPTGPPEAAPLGRQRLYDRPSGDCTIAAGLANQVRVNCVDVRLAFRGLVQQANPSASLALAVGAVHDRSPPAPNLN